MYYCIIEKEPQSVSLIERFSYCILYLKCPLSEVIIVEGWRGEGEVIQLTPLAEVQMASVEGEQRNSLAQYLQTNKQTNK